MTTKRKTKKKRSLADLPAQPDPRAPLDSALLVSALQPLRKLLEEDLLARAKQSPAIQRALHARHAREKSAERTADPFAVWQRRSVEQIAAAWILSAVFVRTLEDRGLLEHARIAGPGALDAQRTFLQLAPSLSEREYLLTLFREMTRLPAARDLFDHHNPVWLLAPSAEGAKALLALFRAGGDEAPSLRFGQPDTRFLGDLYQDLNESVRERFALLQTPDFVERFILERTLEPAIQKFGLDDTDLIDPTCGSGHFLLGAFDRLFEHHRRAAPGLDARQAAERALDQVYGADINPYAVAIARFRLTLSYLDKAGHPKLSDAPKLPLHLAVADSLLYNPQLAQGSLFHQEDAEAAKWERRAFDFEDEGEARAVLGRTYAAVVGNPPYITVKDKALRDRYRALYSSAVRQYSLSVPFAERFFQLARRGGRVGQITANSFMKREFGKKLIQDYLPTVNLDLIVNTSGAYIPGHGTPTVLLFGTAEAPQQSKVRAVLAKRGEPTTPADPARGKVWSSIADHVDDVGFDDDYITVAELERASLASHPWSLAGGGAGELKALLEERAEKTLGEIADEIGYGAVTREDDLYELGAGPLTRWRIPRRYRRAFIAGEYVRDWAFAGDDHGLWPYDDKTREPVLDDSVVRALWPWRRGLSERVAYGKTQLERGLPWTAYSMFFANRDRARFRIAFAFVATHNHFVLDRGGKVFKQTAPIIKLPETATEEDHLALLAYLNSSTACFWMKQVCQNRGAEDTVTAVVQGDTLVIRTDRAGTGSGGGYEFASTPLKSCPLFQPANTITLAASALEIAARHEQLALTDTVDRPSAELLDERVKSALASRDELIAIQEEIDWRIYAAAGLAPPECIGPDQPHPIPLGTRPYEILLAKSYADRVTSAIGCDGQTLVMDIPEDWDQSQRALWLRRMEAIRSSEQLRTIETDQFKHRWTLSDDRKRLLTKASTSAMHDCELVFKSVDLRHSSDANELISEHGRALVQLLAEETGVSEKAWMKAALEAEAVPYLAAHRYTDKGLEKRAAWEHTWALQRKEDAGENVGDIPVPPKYDQKDFRSPTYYRLRGKLDVPKERFISYPGCESDEDGEPVYGWAGWDHAQRAQALVALYDDRKTREGWPKDRLIPILAGVLELLPWLEQWHSQPMPDYDTTFFEAYDAFLETELRTLQLTRQDLQTWRPPTKTRSRKR